MSNVFYNKFQSYLWPAYVASNMCIGWKCDSLHYGNFFYCLQKAYDDISFPHRETWLRRLWSVYIEKTTLFQCIPIITVGWRILHFRYFCKRGPSVCQEQTQTTWQKTNFTRVLFITRQGVNVVDRLVISINITDHQASKTSLMQHPQQTKQASKKQGVNVADRLVTSISSTDHQASKTSLIQQQQQHKAQRVQIGVDVVDRLMTSINNIDYQAFKTSLMKHPQQNRSRTRQARTRQGVNVIDRLVTSINNIDHQASKTSLMKTSDRCWLFIEYKQGLHLIGHCNARW